MFGNCFFFPWKLVKETIKAFRLTKYFSKASGTVLKKIEIPKTPKLNILGLKKKKEKKNPYKKIIEIWGSGGEKFQFLWKS